jgi:uncharacterized membrane protein
VEAGVYFIFDYFVTRFDGRSVIDDDVFSMIEIAIGILPLTPLRMTQFFDSAQGDKA